MMRSLWTAASGMRTQQSTVDTISNNLSNVNTTAFKKERLEFKELLYETLKEAGDVTKGGAPVNMQVGHGVRNVAMVKNFGQGTFERTEGPLDFTIEGPGFFAVQNNKGEIKYTRDGAFNMSIYNDSLIITSGEGRPVMGVDGEPLVFPDGTLADQLLVDEKGNFSMMKNGEKIELGIRIQIVQFKNVQGLKSLGGALYEPTIASGDPIIEAEAEGITESSVVQGGLEGSNVQAVEEMVKLIVAQRAYELSSKAIQTSDEMLARANELKR